MRAAKLDTRIRQEQIVHAALSVVATDGLKRLSVARVARHVGLVPSALYRHFRSKDQIVDAVLESVQDRLLDNARAARDDAADAVGRLHALLKRHTALIGENPGLPRLVFAEDVYTGQPRRRSQMYKAIQSYLQHVADMVADGQRNGDIAADIQPQAAALMFLGLVQPPAVLAQLSGGQFDARARAEGAWNLFERAIRRR